MNAPDSDDLAVGKVQYLAGFVDQNKTKWRQRA